MNIYKFESPDRILDYSRSDLPSLLLTPDQLSYVSLIDIQMERVNQIVELPDFISSTNFMHVGKYLTSANKEDISIAQGLPILLRLTLSVQSKAIENILNKVMVSPKYLDGSMIIEGEEDSESYMSISFEDSLNNKLFSGSNYKDRDKHSVCNCYYLLEADSRLKEIEIGFNHG